MITTFRPGIKSARARDLLSRSYKCSGPGLCDIAPPDYQSQRRRTQFIIVSSKTQFVRREKNGTVGRVSIAITLRPARFNFPNWKASFRYESMAELCNSPPIVISA